MVLSKNPNSFGDPAAIAQPVPTKQGTVVLNRQPTETSFRPKAVNASCTPSFTQNIAGIELMGYASSHCVRVARPFKAYHPSSLRVLAPLHHDNV